MKICEIIFSILSDMKCDSEIEWLQSEDGKENLMYMEEDLKNTISLYIKDALLQASEKAKMKVIPSDMEEWEYVPNEITKNDIDDCEDFYISIDKNSIINSYKLEDIK